MIFYNNEVYYGLDIETGKANVDVDSFNIPACTWLAYGYFSKYDKHGKRLSTMYFRTWDMLKERLDFIQKFASHRVCVFVHNLSFEGDFLIKNIAPAKHFTANSNHNFIQLILEGYDKIEFRCSYMLSGMSLRDLGKTIGLDKLEDDYKSYLPYQKIPEKSKEYCQRDVDIVGKYIATVIKEYGRLTDIPLTKTGRVRKKMREYYDETEKDANWDLYPDENVYDLINDSFAGGITTTNPRYTGIVLKNVHSYDKRSSYPSVMLIEQYPSTMTHKHYNTISEYQEHKHFIIRVKLTNFRTKYDWGWFSTSKATIKDNAKACVWNGKILYCDEVEICINDVDLENLMNTYTWEKYEIIDGCYSDEHSKLPRCYIKTIEEYAKAKDQGKRQYKANPTQENYDKYMRAKGDFNSIYGMCVQKICPQEYKIDEYGIWEAVDKPYKKSKKHMHRNFLYGNYITAYARRSLIYGIIDNCEANFVYCDTDSIKFLGKNEFIDRTPELIEYQYNPYIFGLGKFEYEGTYDIFITYGAKKYYYEQGDHHEHVVAGLPKDVECTLDDFKCGTIFKDCKLAHVYINDAKNEVIATINGEGPQEIKIAVEKVRAFKEKYHIKTNGGVALYPVSYELNMSDNDKELLAYLLTHDKFWDKEYKEITR